MNGPLCWTWALCGGRAPNYRHSTDDPAQKNNPGGFFQAVSKNYMKTLQTQEEDASRTFICVYLCQCIWWKEDILVERVSKPTIACLRVDGCYTQSVLVGLYACVWVSGDKLMCSVCVCVTILITRQTKSTKSAKAPCCDVSLYRPNDSARSWRIIQRTEDTERQTQMRRLPEPICWPSLLGLSCPLTCMIHIVTRRTSSKLSHVY